MKRLLLLAILLFALPVIAQSNQPGCCCNIDGDAQKGSIQLATDCDIGAGFVFVAPSPSSLFGRPASTVCQEFCSTQQGLELIDVEKKCGDPTFKPAPKNLLAQPVKGSPLIQLRWIQDCLDVVNTFEISRC